MSTVAAILERELENHCFGQARLQGAVEAMEIGLVYGRERLDLGAERLSEIEKALSAYGEVPANSFELPPYHISGGDVDSLIAEAMCQEAVRDEGNSVETEDTQIEIDAAPQERSILVLQGRRITMEQVVHLQEGIEEAVRLKKWPIILNYDGPVYWVPVGAPEEVTDGSPSTV